MSDDTERMSGYEQVGAMMGISAKKAQELAEALREQNRDPIRDTIYAYLDGFALQFSAPVRQEYLDEKKRYYEANAAAEGQPMTLEAIDASHAHAKRIRMLQHYLELYHDYAGEQSVELRRRVDSVRALRSDYEVTTEALAQLMDGDTFMSQFPVYLRTERESLEQIDTSNLNNFKAVQTIDSRAHIQEAEAIFAEKYPQYMAAASASSEGENR